MSSHVVKEVDFTGARQMGLTGEDATLECSCGATMEARAFSAHRLEVRAGRGIRNRPDKVIPWSLKGGNGQW